MGLVQLPAMIQVSTQGTLAGGTLNTNTVNATGESVGIIGRVRLAGGPGSKVLSSAGGAIFAAFGGTQTFANGSTNLRIGVQDVDLATGLEDGTFDVYADLVGGTDTITASSWRNTPMESGSKTIAHGDLVAIVIEMTVRAGIDSVTVFTNAPSLGIYGSADTAALAKTTAVPLFMLKFDDGTYGWIEGADRLQGVTVSGFASNYAVDSGTSPDEVGAVFTLPFRCGIEGVVFGVGGVAAGEDFEVILYSDPIGSPVAERTVAYDPDVFNSTAAPVMFTPFIIEPNTRYALMVRPTTAGSITVPYFDLGSGFDVLKATQPFPVVQFSGRTDQAGPFIEIQPHYLPVFRLLLGSLDDGSGGASGALPFRTTVQGMRL